MTEIQLNIPILFSHISFAPFVLGVGFISAIAFAYLHLYGSRPSTDLPTVDNNLSTKERVQKWLHNAGGVLQDGYAKVG